MDSILVFADLSNAFDTLTHKTILDKLRVYGLTESSINWYSSYLKHRAQFVGLAGVKSEIIKMDRGVPQGSLNGSILFSIVYGDVVIMKIEMGGTIFILYADDLSIRLRLCKNQYLDEMALNTQMSRIITWMNCNLLSFNPDKTEIVLVARGSREPYRDLKLTMGNQIIRPKRACRMLGMYFCFNFRQDWYINQMKGNLISFLNQRLYFLSKLKPRVGEKQFRSLVYGLFFSKIYFCVQTYSNCTEVLKDEIRLTCNRAVRMSSGVTLADRQRTVDLYFSQKFLSFDMVQRSQDVGLLWSVMYSGNPKYLYDKIWGMRSLEEERIRDQGPVTRARASNMRPRFTRNNTGTYHQRRTNWMGRALRFNEYLITKQSEFFRKMSRYWSLSTRKKLLKEFLLDLEHDKVVIPS